MPRMGTPDHSPASADARTLMARVEGLERQVELLALALQRSGSEVQQQLEAMLEVLTVVHDEDHASRRRLRALRTTPEYAEAFEAEAPLVSVVIATLNRPQLLCERALHSALEQTHPEIEVIVVGDAAGPATERAVAAVGDPRVRFIDLPYRGPYPDPPTRRWYVAGSVPFNAGVAAARGRWIAPLGDDDAFDPGHVSRLLERARADRLEFVYGLIRMVMPDGREETRGEFPPRLGQVNLQSAIYHAGLRFMELEVGHAWFGIPNDWGLVRRMMRAGVSMGMVDEVSVTYWPSIRHDLVAESTAGDPVGEVLRAAERRATDAQLREAELLDRRDADASRIDALMARIADLERELGSMPPPVVRRRGRRG